MTCYILILYFFLCDYTLLSKEDSIDSIDSIDQIDENEQSKLINENNLYKSRIMVR